MTSPSFVRRIRANAAHLLSLVRAIEDREYRPLDAEWHNFLQAIDIGLKVPEALPETAELWKELIGFIDSRGYYGAWQPVTKRLADKVSALSPGLACRVANEAGFFFQRVNDITHSFAMHDTALKSAEVAGNRFERALAILGLGNVQANLRQYDDAEANVRAALEVLDELDVERLQYLGGLTALGIIELDRGNYASAARSFEQAVQGYMEAGHRRKAVNSMCLLSRAQDLAGDHQSSVATLEAALELLRPGIDLITWTDVYIHLGTAHYHLQDYPRAKAAFLAIDLAELEKRGLGQHLMLATNNIGNVALKEKDWAAAKEHLMFSIRQARSLGYGINLGNSLGDLAEALLNLGERDPARAALDEAVDVLEGYPENAWARKRLAAILAQRREAFG
jgi:tetratricopeptide (TPR) repeat protein